MYSNIPLLFRVLNALHISKFPTSLTSGSSLSNNYTIYLLNVKMLPAVNIVFIIIIMMIFINL